MEDPRSAPKTSSPSQDDGTLEASLAADLTHHLLPVLRGWATPIVEWVQAQGGEPRAVVVAIVETLRALADGLEEPGVDDVSTEDAWDPR